MKKVLSLILVFVFSATLATGTMSSFAEADAFDDSFDKDTAKGIIAEFIEIRSSIGMFFNWYEVGNTKEAFKGISSTFAQGTPDDVPDWYTYAKVKEGYGPDEVKAMIRGLFVDELAETVIDGAEAFFNRYYQENGSWYYYFYMGWDKLSYVDGDRPCTYFNTSELDNIKTRLEPDGNTAYVSVPVHRYYDVNDGEADEARLDANVIFRLSKVGDTWKISELDLGSMIFRADADKLKGDTLTEEAVRETLIALICDLYSLTLSLSDCRYDTYSFAANSRYHLFKTFGDSSATYSAMEGDLADPGTWHEYAEKFCSAEVADYLLYFKKGVRLFDNKLYFRCETCEEYTVGREEFQYSYKLQKALSAPITIEQISSDKAVATCGISWFPEQMTFYEMQYPVTEKKTTIRLEYEKGEDGWKVVNKGFIDTLDNEIYTGPNGLYGGMYQVPDRDSNAETGDVGIAAVVFAAALALAVLIRRRQKAVRS